MPWLPDMVKIKSNPVQAQREFIPLPMKAIFNVKEVYLNFLLHTEKSAYPPSIYLEIWGRITLLNYYDISEFNSKGQVSVDLAQFQSNLTHCEISEIPGYPLLLK